MHEVTPNLDVGAIDDGNLRSDFTDQGDKAWHLWVICGDKKPTSATKSASFFLKQVTVAENKTLRSREVGFYKTPTITGVDTSKSNDPNHKDGEGTPERRKDDMEG